MICGMEFSLEQLDKVAEKVIEAINSAKSDQHATLVIFSGDLGAGKTTLIKEIAKQLGITDDLQSPTYVIYKRYGNVIHGDMYRLESEQEILNLGWEELLADPENVLLIEWPEKIAGVIPEWAIRATLSYKGETTRAVDIEHIL
jgi:tRNA threonylcarbamoyladenosine biosynthesis protein TsaE